MHLKNYKTDKDNLKIIDYLSQILKV